MLTGIPSFAQEDRDEQGVQPIHSSASNLHSPSAEARSMVRGGGGLSTRSMGAAGALGPFADDFEAVLLNPAGIGGMHLSGDATKPSAAARFFPWSTSQPPLKNELGQKETSDERAERKADVFVRRSQQIEEARRSGEGEAEKGAEVKDTTPTQTKSENLQAEGSTDSVPPPPTPLLRKLHVIRISAAGNQRGLPLLSGKGAEEGGDTPDGSSGVAAIEGERAYARATVSLGLVLGRFIVAPFHDEWIEGRLTGNTLEHLDAAYSASNGVATGLAWADDSETIMVGVSARWERRGVVHGRLPKSAMTSIETRSDLIRRDGAHYEGLSGAFGVTLQPFQFMRPSLSLSLRDVGDTKHKKVGGFRRGEIPGSEDHPTTPAPELIVAPMKAVAGAAVAPRLGDWGHLTLSAEVDLPSVRREAQRHDREDADDGAPSANDGANGDNPEGRTHAELGLMEAREDEPSELRPVPRYAAELAVGKYGSNATLSARAGLAGRSAAAGMAINFGLFAIDVAALHESRLSPSPDSRPRERDLTYGVTALLNYADF